MYDEPADLIASHEATLDTLGLLIGDSSAEVSGGKGWTISEIVNHLLDTDRRFIGRIQRMRRENNPKMRILPDPDYKQLSVLKAWKQFYDLRRRHIQLLRSLKSNEWDRPGVLIPVGDITIASLTRHAAAHDSTHIAQIARRLSGRTD